MSRMRIGAKVRKNAEYKAVSEFLDGLGLNWDVHPPKGKGHPFIRVQRPEGGSLDFSIACTPHGSTPPAAAVARLKRQLATQPR